MVKLDLAGSQELPGLKQCPGAMADVVLNGVRQLGKGLVVAYRNEQWIVAEPALATRLECNHSFADAFRDVQHCSFAIGDGDHRHETRPSIRISCFCELREKQCASISVGSVLTCVAR